MEVQLLRGAQAQPRPLGSVLEMCVHMCLCERDMGAGGRGERERDRDWENYHPLDS